MEQKLLILAKSSLPPSKNGSRDHPLDPRRLFFLHQKLRKEILFTLPKFQTRSFRGLGDIQLFHRGGGGTTPPIPADR